MSDKFYPFGELLFVSNNFEKKNSEFLNKLGVIAMMFKNINN